MGQIKANYESISPIFEESELLHENPLLHQALQKLKNLTKPTVELGLLLIYLP